MASKRGKVFVVIREEARPRYGGDLLLPRLMAGPHYFVCESAAQDGAFLVMRVSLAREQQEPLLFELSLPLTDVLYYIAAVSSQSKRLGFIEEQLSEAPPLPPTQS